MFPCECFLPVCFFPFRKKGENSAPWWVCWVSSLAECDRLCVVAVLDIVCRHAVGSRLSLCYLGGRQAPPEAGIVSSPEVLPSFL